MGRWTGRYVQISQDVLLVIDALSGPPRLEGRDV